MTQQNSRLNNAKWNILIGFFAQIITVALSFLGRKLFVMYLDVEYLGINGLYSNILSVLSLAELGMGTVVSFSLYKPVAENNRPKIRTLMKFYRRVYLGIALLISAVGAALIPFLRFIVNSDLSISDLTTYYVLFLVNTVSSYFVAHKVALLAANQENRVQKLVTLAATILQQIVHICILLLRPDYKIYVASTICVTIFSNMVLNFITNRKYPYLAEKDESDVEIDRKTIIGNVKSTALYKLSTVLINNTDNILMSMLVSTRAVGYYSNYITITGSIQAFMSIVTVALSNGVGNLNAVSNRDRLLDVFKQLVFAYHFISCYCSICLWLCFNDFISIWLGTAYTMDSTVVFVIALNFFMTNVLTPIWSFREATGQFARAKYIVFCTAILNIVFSVVLGRRFGIFGILISTTISKLLTVVWYEPRILFKYVFGIKIRVYWFAQAVYFTCTVLCVGICYVLSKMFPNSLIFLVLQCICYFIVCTVIFLTVNRRNKVVSDLLGIVRRMI